MIIDEVPFFDRRRADAPLMDALTEAFQRVLRSGQFIQGREVEGFEEACAAYLGVPFAIGVSSGSDALTLALMTLGVKRGDAVICPAYTFFATAGSIARLGAQPIFADVDPETYLLDPASVAAQISARTRAIVPVHLFGQCADLAALAAVAAAPIVEDAAQAFGARVSDGRRAGAQGDFGCFSFFPTKNLGGFGDGGLVTTRSPVLAESARMLRAHGARVKHHHARIGYNFRLDALQAALLRVKLGGVDAGIAQRREHARAYARSLGEAGLEERLILPREVETGSTWNQYVVRVKGAGKRDALRAFLAVRRVGTEIYYPVPLHRQPCFQSLGQEEGSLPVAEAAARETLALPIFPELTAAEQEYVIAQILAFFQTGS
ncbi:MAG: DegT/DnrJ/EryC1/StrS family aminotransferase [Minicystis sp.]